MKRPFSILLAVVLFATAACGDDVANLEPFGAGVQWRLSGATCSRSFILLFLVDGAPIATQQLGPGGESAVFAISPGQHVIEAREAVENGVVFFFPTEVTILSGEIFVRILNCPP